MNELKIVRSLLNEMNKRIKYCHWKSNQHFRDALIGVDDLDILIDRSQSKELMKILADLKFKHFYTPSSRTYVGIEDYLGFDEETGMIIHLHLHYNLVVGEKHLKGFHLPFENEVLENRRWDEELQVYCSSYFDELFLLILRLGMKNRKRDILKRKIIETSAYNEFVWLKENCNNFEETLNKNTKISNRIKRKVLEIYNGNFGWRKLKKLKKYLYSDLACYSQGSALHNTIKRNLHELNRVILEIKKRFLNTKYTLLRRRSSTGGTIIAFIGSDGSGKSSSIKEINKWLKKVIDVRYFYLGSGDGNSSLLRKPLKLMKKIAQKMGIIKITNNFSTPSLEVKENKTMNFPKRLWVYTLARERIKKLKYINRCKIRGFVVLTDRYPQNEFEGLCDGPRLLNCKGFGAKKEKQCFRIAQLCPPDLAIKLIVSPEVAKQRKPEEIELETSNNLTERVKKIKFSEKTKSVLIDADKPQEEVILEIKRVIWNEI